MSILGVIEIWDKTHVFLADERFVPRSDKYSNYGLIKEHLLKHIIFLVSGEKKARAVKEMLENRRSTLPAAQVQPVCGIVYLVMDESAASLLSETRLEYNRHSYG
ncbi:MAG: 6-phosphogluconolactonase [Desulfobacterales bacterium]|nr:6-phosphogluconolactonase [Desulfobacterales bacterium]